MRQLPHSNCIKGFFLNLPIWVALGLVLNNQFVLADYTQDMEKRADQKILESKHEQNWNKSSHIKYFEDFYTHNKNAIHNLKVIAEKKQLNLLNEMTADLADSMHEKWQNDTRRTKVNRFKPIKVDGKSIDSQSKLDEYLKAIPNEFHNHYKMIDDGKGNVMAQEDILWIPNRHLAPNNKKENNEGAAVAIQFLHRWLKAGHSADQKFLHAASKFVHQEWLERNGGWASEEQKRSFDELEDKEAVKDVRIVEDAFELYSKAQGLALPADLESVSHQVNSELSQKRDRNGSVSSDNSNKHHSDAGSTDGNDSDSGSTKSDGTADSSK